MLLVIINIGRKVLNNRKDESKCRLVLLHIKLSIIHLFHCDPYCFTHNTQTHEHTHTQAHTHIHTLTHTDIHTYTHTHTHTHTRTHTHTYMQ